MASLTALPPVGITHGIAENVVHNPPSLYVRCREAVRCLQENMCLLIGIDRLKTSGINPTTPFTKRSDVECWKIANLFRSLVAADPINCFAEIPDKDLAKVFQNAAENNLMEMINPLITSDRFKETPSFVISLENALHFAAKNGHIDVVNALIGSDHFRRISAFRIGLTLESAAKNGHVKVVKALIASKHFGEASSFWPHLETALGFAIRNNNIEIAKFLISCELFTDIPTLALEKFTKISASPNITQLLQGALRRRTLRSQKRPIDDKFSNSSAKAHRS